MHYYINIINIDINTINEHIEKKIISEASTILLDIVQILQYDNSCPTDQ